MADRGDNGKAEERTPQTNTPAGALMVPAAPGETTPPRSEVEPEDLLEVARRIGGDIGADNTLIGPAREAFDRFVERFDLEPDPVARARMLYNIATVIDDNGPRDRLMQGVAVRLSKRADIAEPMWAAGAEPSWPHPIATKPERATLAKELDRRGFGYLVDKDLRDAHVVIKASRFLSGLLVVGFATVIETSSKAAVFWAAFAGGLAALALSSAFPYPKEKVPLLWRRVRRVLPAIRSLSATFAAMLTVVAFVYITKDAWDSFGELSYSRLLILLVVLIATAGLVLRGRLGRLNLLEPHRVDAPDAISLQPAADGQSRPAPRPEETRLAVADAGTGYERFNPPPLVHELITRGIKPSAENPGAWQVRRLYFRFDVAQAVQVFIGMLMLAAILLTFSFIMERNGVVFQHTPDASTSASATLPAAIPVSIPAPAAGRSPASNLADPPKGPVLTIFGGAQLSEAMVRVGSVMCSLAAVFFVVVTLNDDKALKTFVQLERTRVAGAIAIWRAYSAAHKEAGDD